MFNVRFSLCLINAAHTYNENEKPPWNAKTAVPSHDFDEWFNMQHRQPRTTDEDFRDYQGSEWRGFKLFLEMFFHPSLVMALFQKSRDQEILFLIYYFYFLASSWGRNGEIVSCAHYKYKLIITFIFLVYLLMFDVLVVIIIIPLQFGNNLPTQG